MSEQLKVCQIVPASASTEKNCTRQSASLQQRRWEVGFGVGTETGQLLASARDYAESGGVGIHVERVSE